MNYSEFETFIRKKHLPKNVKVKNSWGIYDAYKYIRKNGWYNIGRPLKEHEFYSIIRSINNLLAEELKKGNTVVFPCRMGSLELRKRNAGVSIIDGKLKNTYPIDWDSTVKLWYEDAEARENKTLLRNETKEVYSIKYNKFKVNYKNKTFYEFQINRFIKRALKDSIIKGKIDALW